MHSLDDYDYELPEDLIAQTPAEKRDQSRLLHLNRKTGAVAHHRFDAILDLLFPSDLLVVNDTKVIPARLYGQKATGGKVELLIVNYPEAAARQTNGRLACECLIRASKAPKPGARLEFGPDLSAVVKDFRDNKFLVEFSADTAFEEILERQGEVPLPPYIRRPGTEADRQTYQTVYAERKGAVAAPTAGFHFTEALLDRLRQKGIQIVPITLHVSYGTFMPVRDQDIRNHQMHSETYSIPEDTADAVNRAKTEGRRIVAVGTTSVRTLEYAADETGRLQPHTGSCDLFIYPGYRFKTVDAMITNFHLPRSTLLMLVSAFAGRQHILGAYQAAISHGYRFYSYGDAMLIDDKDA
jgi:S-adenosylmethionine:tRNA ribosyltransferase-isomerase